ncbi:MAG: HAD-IIIA family hydrolase [Candidatus Omnitrophica bacterium]|nr:HAD-IIIA family hydrolase [Candidatus Omnitrophota bacterium]
MKVVFLDRDGVINEYPGDREYVKSWQEFKFLPGVKTALEKLSSLDYPIFIVSNQAGVAKGIYPEQALEEINRNMLKALGPRVKIAGIYYCTHREEDNCSCRKPETGSIEKAIEKLKKENYRVDLNSAFFIGDTVRDIATGKKAGLKTILVFSGKEKPENKEHWEIQPDFTAQDLYAAVEIIIK